MTAGGCKALPSVRLAVIDCKNHITQQRGMAPDADVLQHRWPFTSGDHFGMAPVTDLLFLNMYREQQQKETTPLQK